MSDTKQHNYEVEVTWTGNSGAGTTGYRGYERSHVIKAAGKQAIAGSSDPSFRGDPACWNPEELFVASLSACHKLWYLHLCAVEGVIVTAYKDLARGVMVEDDIRGGRMTEVILNPRVTITMASSETRARDLHGDAHAACFLANSVNCAVTVAPLISRVE